MSIILVRVDDRLIHGQVTIGWTRALNANRIVVADDKVAADQTQRVLLSMGADPSAKVSILSVMEAAKQLSEGAFEKERVLLLVKGPESLVQLLEGGLEVSKVNIGNVRKDEGKQRISKELYAGPSEVNAWRKLDEAGIELEAQWLPGQKKTKLNQLIRKV
jgi:mannose/fructose/N-acetylgalactosamine-specific phosphotransferase system component IIB